MTDDSVFRMAFVIVVGIFFPFVAYHRVRSNATREKLDRWQEGAFILFGLRLGAMPLLAGTVAWLINPDWMAWSSVPLPTWLRWVGVALLVGWGALQSWTFHNLGKNLTDTVVTRKEHTLVVTGPYHYVRHPFYVSFAFAGLGASLTMANWFILVAGAIPLAFIVARTPIEERKLIERFGEEYREYMRRVGRFVPRIRTSR